MRYYGGGIGHYGNTSRRASHHQTAMDNEEIGSEWQDVDGDPARLQAEEEELFRRAAQHPDELLQLVPEIAEAGGVHAAILKEIEARKRSSPEHDVDVGEEQGRSDGEDSDWDDDDAERDAVIGIGDGNARDYDQYDLEGYAAP